MGYGSDNQQKTGGFAAEYEHIYEGQEVSPEKVRQDALLIRNLKQDGEVTFNISLLHIEKKYGMVLAQLGFVSFIYLDPVPIGGETK